MKNAISSFVTAAFMLVAVAYAAPAASQEATTPAEFCNDLANVAEAAAIDRDSGESEADAIAYIGRDVIDADMRSVLIGVIRLVYTPPTLDPSTEAGIAFIGCINLLTNEASDPGYES